MEAVRAFNNELSSLYESKPPISRAKMTAVTKSAIKAIKFYKHVVQSVEKFIMKCRPEYKVPGLYVIDSIVRQSRHQFGADKDVFAPRFAKNVVPTFLHLFKCPQDDKARVVRVLNLWQKNGVFGADVIQPLLDMANPELTGQSAPTVKVEVPTKPPETAGWSGWNETQENVQAVKPNAPNTKQPTMQSLQSLIQQTQEAQHQQQQTLHQLQALQQQIQKQSQPSPRKQTTPQLDNSLMAQIQALSASLAAATAAAVSKPTTDSTNVPEKPVFNKALLDFDYGDEDEDTQDRGVDQRPPVSQPPPSTTSDDIMGNLANADLLAHLKQTLQQTEAPTNLQDPLFQQQLLHHLQPPPQLDPHQLLEQHFSQQVNQSTSIDDNQSEAMHVEETVMQDESEIPAVVTDEAEMTSSRHSDKRMKSRSPSKRRRSRSRSRSPRRRRRRSRSTSRSRSRRKRSRSRSRSRSPRHKERRREREREKERQKKGLPAIKEKTISVCSTTIFLGHLAKATGEKDIKEIFEEFGQIQSIDIIPPRGCAFVCMEQRQDSHKALQKLKNLKLHGNTIKMSWATNKGTKGAEYKKYWDSDLGVAYIPWDKLATGIDLEELSEGGMIDQETLPPELRKAEETEVDEKKDLAKMSQDDLIALAAAQAASVSVDTPTTDQGTPGQTPGTTPSQTPMQTPGQMHPQMPPSLLARPPGYPAAMQFPPFPAFNPRVPPPPFGMPGFNPARPPPMGVPPPGMMPQMNPAPHFATAPMPVTQKLDSGDNSDIGKTIKSDSDGMSDIDERQSARVKQLLNTLKSVSNQDQNKTSTLNDFSSPQRIPASAPGTVTPASPLIRQPMPFMPRQPMTAPGMVNQLGVRMPMGMAMNMQPNQMGMPNQIPVASMPLSTSGASNVTNVLAATQQMGQRLPAMIAAIAQSGILNRPAGMAGGQIPNLMSINIQQSTQQQPGNMGQGILQQPGSRPPLLGAVPSRMPMGQNLPSPNMQSLQRAANPVQYPLSVLQGATTNVRPQVPVSGDDREKKDGFGVSQVLNAHLQTNRSNFSRDVDDRTLDSGSQEGFNERFSSSNRSAESGKLFDDSDERDRWRKPNDDWGMSRGGVNEKWSGLDAERGIGFEIPPRDRDWRGQSPRGGGMPDMRDWRGRRGDRGRDWREERGFDRKDRDREWRGNRDYRDNRDNRDSFVERGFSRGYDRDRDRDRERDYSRDKYREFKRERSHERDESFHNRRNRDDRTRSVSETKDKETSLDKSPESTETDQASNNEVPKKEAILSPTTEERPIDKSINDHNGNSSPVATHNDEGPKVNEKSNVSQEKNLPKSISVEEDQVCEKAVSSPKLENADSTEVESKSVESKPVENAEPSKITTDQESA
uniref:Protein SCAF8-like isoform X2 n=1 Tax=Saccoglossus kowalevskii TaxID=10224 RepID=A0ABM0MGY7_SACKO|nr:PREDICTED: protein SCAF8-like isoform X2 [Saccoglossus kowalevskii]